MGNFMAEPGMDPWSLAAIEQNRHWLTAFLLGATGDRTATDDLVQEVFRIAYEKRASFAAGSNFGGWLRAIAQTFLAQHYKKMRREPVLVGDAYRKLEEAAARREREFVDPEGTAARTEAFRRCLARLAGRAREILRLRYGEARSAQEVALVLGMSVSAVNVAAFRAREATAECVRRSAR